VLTWRAISPPFRLDEMLNRETPTFVAGTEELLPSINVADA
jgi:hypothetical protein